MLNCNVDVGREQEKIVKVIMDVDIHCDKGESIMGTIALANPHLLGEIMTLVVDYVTFGAISNACQVMVFFQNGKSSGGTLVFNPPTDGRVVTTIVPSVA